MGDVPGFSGKEFKLNAERNNGRAAMMGIIGMIIHEALTGNPLPGLSWLQIVLVVAVLDNSVLAQDPAKAPGDVGDGTFCQPGKVWVRYPDVPGFSGKEFKLNAERVGSFVLAS